MNELRLNIQEYNITLHLLVGIWLVRMTLHKTCKGTFFHDHMMRCPVDKSMLLWPLKSTFLIEIINFKLTSNETKKNSRKFHFHKSLKFSTWTRATAELSLLLLLFIQQIEILENHMMSWQRENCSNSNSVLTVTLRFTDGFL